jgi:hypothetical protein
MTAVISPRGARRPRSLVLAPAIAAVALLVGVLGAGTAYADSNVNATWNPITFNNGVPVGGESQLLVYPNGAYNFRGHFHVSGAPSYNIQIACVVKFSSGALFEWSESGRVHGTFEAGSRDWNWNDSGTNPAFAQEWSHPQNYSWRCNAGADWSISSMLNSLKAAVGYVTTVVAVVGPLI